MRLPTSGRLAAAVLLCVADPPDDELPLPPIVRNTSFDDEPLVGKAFEWPFGPPILREQMRNSGDEFETVVHVDIKELRARRAAAEAARLAETRAALAAALADCSADASADADAGAARMLRAAPRLAALAPDVARERVAQLHRALPDAHARRRALLGAPSLLLHASLPASLPAKLAAISEATGLAAERVVVSAPTLLLLDASQLAARVARLRASLPAEGGLRDALPSVLRRAPRLLCKQPERVGGAFETLRATLPAECDAAALAAAQPTLLAQDAARTAAKLARLRTLCTAAEWRALCASASLGRVLTASDAVIERLAEPDDGAVAADEPGGGGGGGGEAPRAIVATLLMTRAAWEARRSARRKAAMTVQRAPSTGAAAAPTRPDPAHPGARCDLTFTWRRTGGGQRE
jgi:hypothetical protein